VYRQASVPVRVTISAENPVVLAGLRRVAALIGARETIVTGDEDFTLRSTDLSDVARALDVNCSEDAVVVTVHRRPAPEIWAVIFDLVEQILPTTSTGTNSASHRA
jgi:hypothetical protein